MISERRRRQSGGNALLESVFTILPTSAIIFAFADFSLAGEGCSMEQMRDIRGTRSTKSNPQKRRQRGNVYAETALVVIPFFALLLGILDFGMAIFVRTTIQNAVAAGVRYAVTYQNMTGYGMDDSIRLTTQANAMGFLGATSAPNPAITVNYYNPTSGLGTPLSGGAN